MKTEFTLESLARVSLVLGVVFLIFLSFDGLRICRPLLVLLLSLGILFGKSAEKPRQEETDAKSDHACSFIITLCSLVAGISSSCYLILTALSNVDWGRILYFTPRYLPRFSNLGIANIGFILGSILATAFLVIISRDVIHMLCSRIRRSTR